MNDLIIRGPAQKLPQQYFGQILHDKLLEGGSQIAIIDEITGEKTSYYEILQRSINLAHHLKTYNLTKNDVISICSDNSIYYNIPVIAAIFLGIPVAPINNNYSYGELLHAFNLSKPKLVFCTTQILDQIIQVSKKITSIKKIITFNELDEIMNKSLTTIDRISQINNENVAAVLCSSGTTGLPKGVMLSYKNFLAGYSYIKDPDYGDYNSKKISLSIVPFYHIYGLLVHLYMLMTHMKMIILTRFEDKIFLRAIEKHRVSITMLVPPLLLFLVKSPLVNKYDLTSLKEIICGAAPLSNELQQQLTKKLNVVIRQGYGQTELTLAVTMQQSKNIQSGNVGTLVPGIDCKIVDPETGKTVGHQQNGELCFRGSLVMKGYIGDKNATDATIDPEGWLHSGDVGYYDYNTRLFYIVDRLKELIKYKGFQVPPAELEALLLSHPDILDCGVVGKFDNKTGEELATAFVVKNPNAMIKESDVIKFVADNISYHKRLHGGVIFIEAIPKNPTGKILRRILRERLNGPPSSKI